MKLKILMVYMLTNQNIPCLLDQVLTFSGRVIKGCGYWRSGLGSREGVAGPWTGGFSGHKLISSLLESISLRLYHFLLTTYQLRELFLILFVVSVVTMLL